MTVLIAQHTKDKIILGADTGTFYGNYHKIHLNNHKGRMKIVEINNQILQLEIEESNEKENLEKLTETIKKLMRLHMVQVVRSTVVVLAQECIILQVQAVQRLQHNYGQAVL